MQAYYLERFHSIKEVFKLKAHVLPTLAADEVEIDVQSFGLNYADVMARNGMYKEAPPLPCVLGYEVVGIIKNVQNPNHFHLLGKRVLAFTRFGGYSQFVNVPFSNVVEINDLPTNFALSLATQGCTAWFMAYRSANVQAGDSVLIHAASGGVGSMLIQLCKLKGAFVIAKVGSESKIKNAKSLGADVCINYKEQDYDKIIEETLGVKSIDVSFNPSGGSTFKKDFKLLTAGGKIVLFGAAELSGKKWGILSKLNFVRKMGLLLPIVLLMTSKSVMGVNMLSIGDQKPELLKEAMLYLLSLAKDNRLKVLEGKQFPHTQLHAAHNELASGKSIGKIGIDW